MFTFFGWHITFLESEEIGLKKIPSSIVVVFIEFDDCYSSWEIV